jgi:transcriptional regulator
VIAVYRQLQFDIADRDDALAFAARCGRGHLITLSGTRMVSSFIPMLCEPGDEAGSHVIVGHLARANPQWRAIDPAVDALAIFTGNDAYVSPSNYPTKVETGRVVPTWNYSVVQVSGRLEVHDDVAWVIELVRRLTDHHEAGRPAPWSIDDAPAGYIESTARAIVGITLHVDRVEGARKLSQNRTGADFLGVVAGLSSGDPLERAVAADMLAVRPDDES